MLGWLKLRGCAQRTIISDEPGDGGRVHIFQKFLGHVTNFSFWPFDWGGSLICLSSQSHSHFTVPFKTS